DPPGDLGALGEPEQRQQRGRLAGAALSHDRHALARRHVQLGHPRHGPPAIADPQVAYLDHVTILRGSSALRSPSPSTLNANAVSRIASPGKVTTHQFVVNSVCPCSTISPHSAVGSCAPSPRYESAAAVRMTPPASSETWTRTGVSEFGSTCRRMIMGAGTPRQRAASTYGRVAMEAAIDADSRAYHGHQVTAMATITVVTLGRSTTARATDSSSAGKARNTSVTRMITSLTQPPAYPATTPSRTPAVAETASTVTAMNSDVRPPYSTRLNTSRPAASVPNQCAPSGARSESNGFTSSGG